MDRAHRFQGGTGEQDRARSTRGFLHFGPSCHPPGFSWSPNAPGSDTREQKTLTFDVAYTATLNGQTKRIHRATKVSFPYSLGPGLYLLTGMLGLLLGNVIKTLTTHKRDFADMLNA